jgi:hypothetical protein
LHATHPLGPLLEENRRLRRRFQEDRALAARLTGLKQWQIARLTRTYADLAASERYRPAVEFFLQDLYGGPELARRDEQMLRVYPLMERMLPKPALSTLIDAVRLETLSQELDAAMVLELPAADPLTTESYATAYRHLGREPDRRRQIDLLVKVGRDLEATLANPLILPLLKMLHRPAHIAGFGALQDFLERGFTAMRRLGDANEFLATIERRESRIMQELLTAPAEAVTEAARAKLATQGSKGV